MNIIIVDDHPLFRMGTKMALKKSNHCVIGDVANADDFWEMLTTKVPDLVLLDIVLGCDVTGVDIARRLKAEFPTVKILVLSVDTSVHTIKELLDIGIEGFISKNAPNEEVLHAINAIAGGQSYFGQDVDSIIQQVIVAQQDNKAMFTDRELEIIQLSCQGKLGKEIADIMNISLRTVDTHKTNIFRKVGIDNGVELVLYAIKNGIVEI